MATSAELKKKKQALYDRIDQLRSINPYYPIGYYTGQISRINMQLREMEKNYGTEKVESAWIAKHILGMKNDKGRDFI